MNKEEAQKILEELYEVRPEILNDKAKRLFEAIMQIADERDKAYKIIDKMAEKINQAYFDKENMYIWFEEKILPKDEFGLCEYKDLGTRKTRIKEYFKKGVDEDVKD